MPDAPIQISVPTFDIARLDSAEKMRAEIFLRCTDAGMPLTLSPITYEIRGESGILTTWQDLETGALVVRWEPDPPPPAPLTLTQQFKALCRRIWEA